ncbi:hypothetical protein Tco_0294043 [Tanacetum coccineum]
MLRMAFSSTNTHDYTPTSPDYSPASPGNSSPDPSYDLSKYLLASLAISPFHDDQYMKVMQAYNATSNELPIPLPQAPIAPPTVLPQSPVFEIGESSHKTHLKRHEEQIETILNHLNELPLERIEHMEDKIKGLGNGRREQIRHDDEIVLARVRETQKVSVTSKLMPPKRTSTSEAPAMTQAAIKKLVAHSVAAALEAQAATMAKGAVGLIHCFEQTELVFSRSNCAEENKVTFSTGTLTDDVLSWWNAYTQPIGI